MLTLLVDLEPEQAQLLDKVCSGALISEAELHAEGALGASLTAGAFGESNEEQQGLF